MISPIREAQDNVAHYFCIVLDTDLPNVIFGLDVKFPGKVLEELAETPLASVCGHECKRVIDAARTLLDFVERATARDYHERQLAIHQVTLRCCLTFING